MDLHPRIITIPELKLIGKRVKMSFAHNTTTPLWQSFMPRRKEIENAIGSELYSLEVYPAPQFLQNFKPNQEFEKWAAMRVVDFRSVPAEMETCLIPTGLYAVFLYRGKAREAAKTYPYIFETWLLGSAYSLDHRPHFALMGEKYRNDGPDSEEEFWIPVKKKEEA